MTQPLLLAAALALLATGCGPPPDAARPAEETSLSDEASFWVRTAGDRRDLLDGDLDARIALDSLAGVRGLYAIGPVEGLQGEVTVRDGVPSISTVAGGAVRVDSTFDQGAVFLVYASATDWRALPVDRTLAGLADAEAFVREAAEGAGLDLSRPFPFRIEGRVDSLVYHVLFKTDDAPHDRAEHHKAKRTFEAADADADLVGFWMHGGGVGAYTHPGRRTHLHAILRDRSASGHVDGLRIPAGATLYLPR